MKFKIKEIIKENKDYIIISTITIIFVIFIIIVFGEDTDSILASICTGLVTSTLVAISMDINQGKRFKKKKYALMDEFISELEEKIMNISYDNVTKKSFEDNVPVINVVCDYNEISRNDTPRLSETGEEILGTNASVSTFRFSSNMELAEFKVCVYDESKTAETAIAIMEESANTKNMTGENVENFPVECSISFQDYEKHPVIAEQTGENKSGHIIVLGKSQGGKWSSYSIDDCIKIDS